MSLSTVLADNGNLINLYLRERYPHTLPLVRAANNQLADAATIRPDAVEGYPWATVRRAATHRIRYSFTGAPYRPYVALHGAHLLTTRHPNAYPFELLREFFVALDQTLDLVQPAGRILDPDAERILAPYCCVLGLLEEVARTPRYTLGPLFDPQPAATLDALLGLATPPIVADIAAQGQLFLARQGHLLKLPHTVGPQFAGADAVGGIRAELIVDGTLIAVRAAIQPHLEAHWLREVAAAALLDFDDTYHLRAAGLYLARQGILLQRPLDELIHALSGDPSLTVAPARHELQALLRLTQGKQRASA